MPTSNEPDGLISLASPHAVAETARRFCAAVRAAGLTVFAEIDHGRNAAEVGLPLRPTLLIVFGSPRGGTPLMQQRQSAGLDLPFKALVWEDERGTTWIGYNDPSWLARRHCLGGEAAPTVDAIAVGMEKLVSAATRS